MKTVPFTSVQKILSLILKLTVVFCALCGTILSASAGRNSFMGGTTVFMYFTIQSNLALAVVCGLGICKLFGKEPPKNSWFVIKLMATVSITLTGAVFCFVLAPTMSRGAWSLPNVLTHVVVPLASIADYLMTCPNGNLRGSHTFFTILPPLAYVFYAALGYVLGWQFAPGINYPYFFLNWGSPAGAFGFTKGLPFMGCMWWILILLVLLLGVGRLYVALTNLLRKVMFRETKA